MSNRESIYKGVLRIKLENTKYVIAYAKKTDELLARLRRAGKNGIQEEAMKWATEHGDEFGDSHNSRLTIELYDVFWDKVWYAIKTTK